MLPAKQEVHLWSAGCATGEEPYSLAILLDQFLAGLRWQVVILATDINPVFLARARQALYRQWSFRQTDVYRDSRYFSPQTDSFCLVPRVRDRVRFAYLNLVKDVYPSPLTGTLGVDLILFRNVAIYLKPEVTRAIIERFWRALRPGGWLLVGEVELNLVPAEGFEVKRFDQATFFQKKVGPPGPLAGASGLSGPLAGASGLPRGPFVQDWVPLPTAKPAPPIAPAPPWDRVQVNLAQRDFVEAERTIARIASSKDRAALRLRCAQALLACAEQARARRMLETCLAEDPLLLEARLLQASFAEEAGDLVAAEQSYRQALYIDRNCPMGHFHLALVQQQKGDHSGAARSLSTTLKLIQDRDPHALVEYGEGICYGRLKEMVAVLIPE